ncbi:MAG TPA: hypothetical protein VEF04_01905, partial [Blastocatellia bacterium]|nr:hypothetical protein [Blastocatellia bacterium]
FAMVILIWRREWWLLSFALAWTAYAILPPGPVGAWRFRILAEPIFSLIFSISLNHLIEVSKKRVVSSVGFHSSPILNQLLFDKNRN